VIARGFAAVVVGLVLAACASMRAVEQRTTQGPSAEQLWTLRVMMANGREPSFEERRYWQDRMDLAIEDYLRRHQDFGNSLQVSTFRFLRQTEVGMSKEQVLILLGPPLAVTTDAGQMEKIARRYWPLIQGNATEAWVYPLGWNFYFTGPRLVDITQYLDPDAKE
jgi:hypothetical protein